MTTQNREQAGNWRDMVARLNGIDPDDEHDLFINGKFLTVDTRELIERQAAEIERLREVLRRFMEDVTITPTGIVVGLERGYFDQARAALAATEANKTPAS